MQFDFIYPLTFDYMNQVCKCKLPVLFLRCVKVFIFCKLLTLLQKIYKKIVSKIGVNNERPKFLIQITMAAFRYFSPKKISILDTKE